MRVHPGGSFYWTLAMAVVVVLMLIAAQSLPTEVRVTPVLLGYVTLAFFAILMVYEFVPAPLRRNDPGPQQSSADGPSGLDEASEGDASQPWSPVLRVMAYIVGFWFLVLFFGLVLIPPIFITVFLVVEARVRFRYAAGCALVACTALITALLLLRVELWLGVIGEVIPNVLGGSILPEL